MPTLDAYVYNALGHILVETTWGDVPAAESVQVRRVHADGTRWPLRTYVWPAASAGEYQHLSGGWAAFWDNEAPLDTPFTYEADAVDVNGAIIQSPIANQVALDTFTRSTINGWGSTESPVIPWTQSGLGAAGDYFTNASQGVMRFTASGVSSNRGMLLDPVSMTNGEFRVYLKSNVLQIGGNGNWSVRMRRNAGTNSFYEFRLFLVAGGNITGNIGRNLNGASASITGFTGVPGVATNDQGVWLYGSIQGYRIRMKAWYEGIVEPTAFMYDFTDTTPGVTGPGDFEVLYSIPSSVTTVAPFDMFVDNLLIRSFDPVFSPTVVTAGPYTLASNGGFWLRDPLRPCNDRRVELCFDPAVPCVPGQGVFFADMQAETYAANSAKFLPTKAALPILVSRQRREPDSALTLVTRTFVDRDNVLATANPGSPLQWAAPPAYGIPDRYMGVDAVQVSRGVPDMTFQPRLVQLPFSTVDRPVGSSEGACGLRFMDLCDSYATWDLAAASGLSYATLVTGTPAFLGFRTWATVNATWASWAAVLAAEPTWQQVLVP